MSDMENRVLDKIDKIEQDVTEIKTAVIKNTIDLEYHIKRTDDLQVVVEKFSELVHPLHQDFVAKQAVDKYKKEQSAKLGMTLKVPSFIYYIVGIVIGLGSIISWFMGKI